MDITYKDYAREAQAVGYLTGNSMHPWPPLYLANPFQVMDIIHH